MKVENINELYSIMELSRAHTPVLYLLDNVHVHVHVAYATMRESLTDMLQA